MPRYMDYHADLKLPQDAIDRLATDTRNKTRDKFGVTQVDLYYNAAGRVYCLLDAPSEQAVRDHHAAINVPVGEINEVTSLT
jgi:hypothetical protein